MPSWTRVPAAPCSPVEGQRRLFNLSESQCPCRQRGNVLHRAWVRRPPECHNEASPAALPGVGTALGEECAFTKKQITRLLSMDTMDEASFSGLFKEANVKLIKRNPVSEIPDCHPFSFFHS